MEKLVGVMRQSSFLFVLLLLATWVVGCSEDRAYLAPPPDLETVDFGDVYLGMSRTRQVYWINRGPRPTRFRGRLLIDPIGQGFNFSLTRDEVIQPGAQTPEVNITFTPYEERTYRAEASPIVRDESLIYTSLTTSIRLLGNGVAQTRGGALSLADGDLVPTRALDFGNVLVGASRTRGFNISNSSDKEITGFEGWFSLRSQVFRVTTPATAFFNVPPKGSIPVIITFSPPWVDRFTDSAIFRDGTGNNFAGTAVNGNGIAQISSGDLFLKDNEDIGTGIPLDFGKVMVRSSDQRTFSIKNRGPTEITVNVTWARGSRGFAATNPPVKIPAGHSIPVTITFTPPGVDTFTDAVTFSDASGNNNLAATSVTGEGVTYILKGGLRLEEQPGGLLLEILDFGQVRVGGTATRTFCLNNGSRRVIITSAGLRAGNQGFSPPNVSPPVTLAPFEVLPVTITFTPSDVDTFEDAVTFSDASGDNMAGVVIRGQGIIKGE